MNKRMKVQLHRLLVACLLLFVAAVSYSCQEHKKLDSAATEDMDRETLTKYRQYMVQGETIYKRLCLNCHLADGKGMAQLYPPLSGSDYLEKYPAKSICGIRYGMQGEIVVNGVTYNQQMLVVETLSPLEIAEVMTYITNSWGNSGGLVTIQTVQKALEGCSQAQQ